MTGANKASITALSMSSQATLLDPALASTVLFLNPDDLRNTNITTSDCSKILYSVSFGDIRDETKIRKVEPGGSRSTLARVKLKEDGEGKISFKNQKTIKLRAWLKPLRFKTL